MKKSILLAVASCTVAAMPQVVSAQEEVTAVTVDETVITSVPCKTRYYVDKTDNWFLQFGAGISMPLVEGVNTKGHHSVQQTANYTVGFGKWFSPYFGWRLAFNGGALHWDNEKVMHKAKYVGANADIMWDMFNSLGGVSNTRVFSIIPFVGIGGTYVWDFRPEGGVDYVMNDNGKYKTNSWTLPVSAGLQLRFRLSKYVDFFAEGRASMYGDNFNNVAYGRPVDMNFTVNGGFSVTFGGREYKGYDPCEYLGYISNLNNQVNDLRAALATTTAALAAAEAQLPCPEVTTVEVVKDQPASLMATVRFNINSATIQPKEMVNVYNVAEWMKQYPDQKVVIVGYADKDTGTSTYNMGLSKRRAQNVYNILVNNYGINPDRLAIQAEGSDKQVYKENNWNRIVLFEIGK